MLVGLIEDMLKQLDSLSEGEGGGEEEEFIERDYDDYDFDFDETMYPADEAMFLKFWDDTNASKPVKGVEYDDDKEEFKEDEVDFQYLR